MMCKRRDVIHRWSFSYKAEFTLYKYKLSTTCIKCTTRHGIWQMYTDDKITKYSSGPRTDINRFVCYRKNLKRVSGALLCKTKIWGTYRVFLLQSSWEIQKENRISEVNVSLGGLFDLILLASQAHEEIPNKDGLHISCFSGTGESLPTYLFWLWRKRNTVGGKKKKNKC